MPIDERSRHAAEAADAARLRAPQRFFLLLAALSLPFFLLGAVFGTVRVGAVDLPASAVMFLLPGTVAVALTARAEGSAGVRRLLRRTIEYSAAYRVWYLLALLIPPLVAATAYLVARAAGWVDAQFSISPFALPVLLVVALFAAACEEAGWTGYVTDPLRQRWGAAATGVILGIVWGVWHVVPLLQADHDSRWIAGWFVGTVAARMIIVWLHDRTGRGVLAAVLMHAMLNVSAGLTPAYDDAVLPVIGGSLTLTVALVALGWNRYRKRG